VQKERTNAFAKGSTICGGVIYLLCIVRVVRALSADGRAPDRACDNGSDIYAFVSNIGHFRKVLVLLTSPRLRDDKKTLTRPLLFRPVEQWISSAGPALRTGLGATVAQDNNAFVFHSGGKQARD